MTLNQHGRNGNFAVELTLYACYQPSQDTLNTEL